MDQETARYIARVEGAVQYLKKHLSLKPALAIQLGTGFDEFARNLETISRLDFDAIPGFCYASVQSHPGQLIEARIAGQPVLILSGRFHFYEGYSTREITLPIRALSMLGVNQIILANCSGGLNPLFDPGTIMILRDHLNFLGENPLRGPHVEQWGVRFPDLSEPYCPRLAKIAFDSAQKSGISNVISGVYACVAGPSLETPAETRWLRESGADAVGMSTVPESIVANQVGMKVLGLSIFGNCNNPDDQQAIALDDVITQVRAKQKDFSLLICGIVKKLFAAGCASGDKGEKN